MNYSLPLIFRKRHYGIAPLELAPCLTGYGSRRVHTPRFTTRLRSVAGHHRAKFPPPALDKSAII